MAKNSSSRRTALRVFAVALLAVVSLADWLPDARRIWLPTGVLGFENDGDRIVAVEPNSPAEAAGLKVGDSIDQAAITPAYRFSVAIKRTLYPGQKVTIPITRRGQKLDVVVTSTPGPMDIGTRIIHVMQELFGLLFLGIGAALVLLRPSMTTWAFYFFCLYASSGPDTISLLVRYPWNLFAIIGANFITACGAVGIMVFGAVFLHDPPVGWRLQVNRWAPAVALVLFALIINSWLSSWWHWWSLTAPNAFIPWLTAIIYLIAVYGLLETYMRATGADRQRIRWVVLAFPVALLAYQIWSSFTGGPYWLRWGLIWIALIAPISVAYATIKYRVIDVSFALSRAIVLTILTSVMVMVFALFDWTFTHVLEQRGLGVALGILSVIVLGFTAQALHRRVDAIVDKTLFKQRHLAEQRLGRLARELPDVQALETLGAILVNEPLQAFGLTSAAFFRRREQNRFERETAIGWPPHSLRGLDLDVAPLSCIADLDETRRIHWRDPGTTAFPSPDGYPVLAMPIVANRQLQAIALYGPHENGADFDPDEIRAINGMMVPAVAAYHHLEAQELRREAEKSRGDSQHVANPSSGGAIDESQELEINPS
ncbi:MAG: PDZ domain-containing protein [Candidatus Eremiobacteraeota bacterium]|nr:PDZ domain-containing protein [Candidatus Eremiobacteraeota bacterium]